MTKNYLSPSILAADFCRLAKDVSLTVENGSEYIHIDVMDGVFVPNITFGFPVINSLRKEFDCIFDVHLMIDKPARYVEQFAKSGADIITFHFESTDSVSDTIDIIRKTGKKVGISIKPNTPVLDIENCLDKVDMVLVMSVEPGFGGQKFMPEMLEKVRRLVAIRKEKNLSFDIEVDGGITLENVDSVLQAGANVIVAGSAVFKKDSIAENTRAFMKKFSL